MNRRRCEPPVPTSRSSRGPCRSVAPWRTGTCGRRCALGPVTVRNRIVFSAHLTNYARDGLPTEQHAAYYAARAAGGAGLIITEEHSTHPTDWPYEKLIHGFHRDVIPGYRRITDAVHRHRVPIFAQINHNGGQASSMYTRLPVWAPSPVADPLFREVPKAVDARPRSTRSSPATRPSPSTAPRAGSTASSCSAATRRSCAASSRRPPTGAPTTTAASLGEPGPAAARDRRRGARRHRHRPGARRAAVRRRADRGRHDHRRRGRGRPDGRGDRRTSTTSTPRSASPRRALFMIEASMHIPPGLRDVHPVGDPQGGRPAGRRRRPVQGPAAGRAGAGRGPLRPRRRRARPDRRRRLRRQGPGRARPTRSGCACRATRSASAGWASTAGSAASRTRAPGARRVARRSTPGRRRSVADGARGRRRPGRPAGGDRRRPQRPPRHRARARRAGRAGRCGWRRSVPNRAELGDMVRNQVTECRRLGVDDRVRRRGRRAERRASAAARPRDRRHRRRAAAAVVGRRPTSPTSCDVRDVLDRRGRTRRRRSWSIDEIGFHHATSVAELLADRGLRGRGRHAGHGRRPGPRHHPRHGEVVDAGRRPRASCRRPTSCRWASTARRSRCSTTRPARTRTRTPDWVVLAVPAAPGRVAVPRPARPPGVSVERVGDCVAPRRAHAAVVEGERAGAHVPAAGRPPR